MKYNRELIRKRILNKEHKEGVARLKERLIAALDRGHIRVCKSGFNTRLAMPLINNPEAILIVDEFDKAI